MFTNDISLIHMNKPDLILNNLQWLICHKTKSKLTFIAITLARFSIGYYV